MEIKFYNIGEIYHHQLQFAVICAAYKGKWIFVRHKDRETWEIPGGHREENEDINSAASRELFEETGATGYELEPICDYSVTRGDTTSFGRLYYAKVTEIGPLPESEICEIKLCKEMPDSLTYAGIQPYLQQKVLEYLCTRALKLLEEDRPRNINMINFMKNYPVFTLDIIEDTVLIRGRSDEDWVYISSQSRDEFQKLILGLDAEDRCFAVLEDWMLSDIIKDREIRSKLSSMKLIYEGTSALPPVRFAAVSLSDTDAAYIYERSKYKEYTSIAYIADRIKNGTGLGIFEKGMPVAWAITHDDGAIGFLNVLEEYRGKGYGHDVTVAMVSRLLREGEVPFVHIEEENKKSMNLAMKVGFKQDRRTHWIKLT
mgnify:CR=1 FL=1